MATAACGALGAAAVLMYSRGLLQYILAPQFFKPVLVGGIALLVLVVIRAFSLGKTFGRRYRPGANEEDSGRVEDTVHGHAHDRGWVPLRCEVLLIPFVLYFCNLPNPSFGAMTGIYLSENRVVALEKVGYIPTAPKGDEVIDLSFQELAIAALRPDLRERFEGRQGRIRGFLQPVSDKEFTLVRLKMTCCASDTVPLRARVVTADSVVGRPGLQTGAWVEVVGLIQFRRIAGQGTYLPVLQVEDLTRIKVSPPEGSEYEFG
jgi:hypothetical protein